MAELVGRKFLMPKFHQKNQQTEFHIAVCMCCLYLIVVCKIMNNSIFLKPRISSGLELDAFINCLEW